MNRFRKKRRKQSYGDNLSCSLCVNVVLQRIAFLLAGKVKVTFVVTLNLKQNKTETNLIVCTVSLEWYSMLRREENMQRENREEPG
jgi:hypothetical protein